MNIYLEKLFVTTHLYSTGNIDGNSDERVNRVIIFVWTQSQCGIQTSLGSLNVFFFPTRKQELWNEKRLEIPLENI